MTATSVCCAPSCRSRSTLRRSRSCAATNRRREADNCAARSVSASDVLRPVGRPARRCAAAGRRVPRGPRAGLRRAAGSVSLPASSTTRRPARSPLCVTGQCRPGTNAGAVGGAGPDRPTIRRTAQTPGRRAATTGSRPAPQLRADRPGGADAHVDQLIEFRRRGHLFQTADQCLHRGLRSEILPEDDPVGPPLRQRPGRLQRDGRRGQHQHRPPTRPAHQGTARDHRHQVHQRRTR